MTVSVAPLSSRQAPGATGTAGTAQRSRALFDLIDPGRVLHAADRAAQSHRVLRRTPAGLQRHLVPEARARAAPVSTNALETLFARGIDPDSEQEAVPRSGAATRWPSRDEVLDVRAGCRRRDRGGDGARRFDLAGREHAAMADGEAIFTALEHEAMHQETLLYMWRRLPYAHKQQAARPLATSSAPRRRRIGASTFPPAAPRSARGVRRRARTARRSARSSPSAGTTSSTRSPSTVPAFDIDAHSVTNAEFLEFIADRRLSAARAVGRRGVGVARGRAGRAIRRSGRGERQRRRCVGLARHVRGDSAAARLAGLRQPGGGVGVRALEGTPAADRGGVSSRRVWQRPTGASASSRGAPRRRSRRTAISTSPSWEPVPAGARPAGASAWGVHDLVGNGWEWTVDRVRAVPRLRRDGVVSGILRGVLRRPARRAEGRVPGDRQGTDPAAASATGSAPTIRTCTRSSAPSRRRSS